MMPLELALTKCRDMAGRIHYGRLPSPSLKTASLSSSRHHVEDMSILLDQYCLFSLTFIIIVLQ